MDHSPGLCDRVAANPPSWEALIRDHLSHVQRHALRLTGHDQEAEDLVQEVFLRAFQRLGRADPVNVEAWLHRVTTNLFIDSARGRQRKPQVPLLQEEAERLVSIEPRPDEACGARTFDEDVAAALAGLKPIHRAAVLLRDVQGMSYLEVASSLHLKLGTVRSHIHRGRAQLRTALAHRAGSMSPAGEEAA